MDLFQFCLLKMLIDGLEWCKYYIMTSIGHWLTATELSWAELRPNILKTLKSVMQSALDDLLNTS